MIKSFFLLAVVILCSISVMAHEHSYGEWIVDRCGALTGIGIRHRVCKGCGESQREIFEGPEHRLRVSILGDSYSTFKGWIPDGAITWYGDSERETWNETDVHEVEQTWWHLLITSLGAELCVNNSYSGTTIGDRGYDGADVQATSFVTRAGELGDDPDVILIFGGTNDAWAGVPMGSWTADQSIRPFKTFITAAQRMCNDLNRFYPNAQKIVILNGYLDHQWKSDYMAALKHIADVHGWKSCAVDIWKCNGNGHPNQEGMRLIAEAVEAELLRKTGWTQDVVRLGDLVLTTDRCGPGEFSVTLRVAEDFAKTEVRYTLDGSEPTTNSLCYIEPIRVAAPCQIRARAFHPSLEPSPIVCKSFGPPLTRPTDEWWDAHPSLVEKLGGVRDADLPSPGSDGLGKVGPDGKLYTVWDDIVCGTDPEDSQSLFKALISISDRRPIVTWEPRLSDEETDRRNYVILGAISPEGPWCPVDVSTTNCRFFRVTVEAW